MSADVCIQRTSNTGVGMAEISQTAVAWEMLSSVVVLRAKARENKLPKLLSSLHGVEVELARIIAGSDAATAHGGEVNGSAREEGAPTAVSAAGRPHGLAQAEEIELRPAVQLRSRTARRGAAPQADQRLRANCKRYKALARQLNDLVRRGEAVASGHLGGDVFGDDLDSMSDPLLAEQHDLSLTISRLRASTFEGLMDKAAVLDDLAEEGSDDPVQVLARSLSRDIMAMGQCRKAAG
jgi:hypothetical protein